MNNGDADKRAEKKVKALVFEIGELRQLGLLEGEGEESRADGGSGGRGREVKKVLTRKRQKRVDTGSLYSLRWEGGGVS